jgi:hypothetical protein
MHASRENREVGAWRSCLSVSTYGIFREHSGNGQGTVREYSGNLRGTLGEHPHNCTRGLCRARSLGGREALCPRARPRSRRPEKSRATLGGLVRSTHQVLF